LDDDRMMARAKRIQRPSRMVSKAKGGGTILLLLIVLACIVVGIPFVSIDLKDAPTFTSAGAGFHRPAPSSASASDWVEEGAPKKSFLSTNLAPNKAQKDPAVIGYTTPNTTKQREYQGGNIHRVPTLSLPNFKNDTSFTSSPAPHPPLPYLVIHMGPDKTGTTAIQSFLKQHHDILEQDGYDISFSKGSHHKAHRLSGNAVLNCFIAPKYSKRPCHLRDKMKEKLKEQVDRFHEQAVQPNIVWSQEGFRWANLADNSDWPWFLERIQPHFQIKIVVVYRRYFDWITSRYNEDYSDPEYSGTALLRWPDDPKGEGVVIPTFQTYFQQDQTGTCPNPKSRGHIDCQNHFANRIHTHPDGRVEAAHPLLEMIRQILLRPTTRTNTTKNSLSVQILNFHSEGEDLLESFFCNSLPPARKSSLSLTTTTTTATTIEDGASLACQEARRVVVSAKKQDQEQQNTGGEAEESKQQLQLQQLKRHEHKARQTSRQSNLLKIQYDRIAVEAHRLQILPSNVSRNAAKHHVRVYYQENINNTTSTSTSTTDDLPWICPSSKDLQVLLDTSKRLEDELLLLLDTAAATTTTLLQSESLFFSQSRRRTSHDDAFTQALRQKKFCHVNVTELLLQEDTAFRTYLSSLSSSSGRGGGGGGGGRKKRNTKEQPRRKGTAN
jgi:hypothetical protein